MSRKLLPDSISIFGKEVQVLEVSNLHDEDNIKVDGLHDPLRIQVEKNLSKEDKQIAFIHETGHAMMDRLFSCAGVPAEVEEVIFDNFAVLMVELFNLSFKRRKNGSD